MTSSAPEAARTPGPMRYWLWRMAGRPAASADELAELRQRDHDRKLARERKKVAELARLTEHLQRAHEAEADRLKSIAEQSVADAAELRRRVAELERQATATEREHERELARLHDGHTQVLAAARAEVVHERDGVLKPLRWDLDQARARIAELEAEAAQREEAHRRELAKLQGRPGEDLAAALDRANQAEERARLAENKIEVLKESLDLARARSAPTPDSRFREAKRAFARAFHPDQGGRTSAEKQRAFLEFWPMLERIERES